MRNLIIAIVCAAALSSCKGQRVVAGDGSITAATVSTPQPAAEAPAVATPPKVQLKSNNSAKTQPAQGYVK